MTDENQLQPPDKPPETKQASNLKIVGINLAIFAGYTLLTLPVNGGFILAGLLMVCQVVVCTILSLYYRKWSWFLSALLVLIIGFSTCVSQVRF